MKKLILFLFVFPGLMNSTASLFQNDIQKDWWKESAEGLPKLITETPGLK